MVALHALHALHALTPTAGEKVDHRALQQFITTD